MEAANHDAGASGAGSDSGSESVFFLPLNCDATSLYSSTSAATLLIAAAVASIGATSFTALTRRL